MAFYDDFNYDLLNQDNIQHGGDYLLTFTTDEGLSEIDTEKLKITSHNYFHKSMGIKETDWDNDRKETVDLLINNLIDETIKKQDGDEEEDEEDYNYIEQNNLNFLLSHSVINKFNDTENFIKDKIKIIKVDETLNPFWEKDSIDNKVISVNTVYETNTSDKKFIMAAKVYYTKQALSKDIAKAIGIENNKGLNTKPIKWILWLNLIYVDDTISNNLFSANFSTALKDIFNKHNQFIINARNNHIMNKNEEYNGKINNLNIKFENNALPFSDAIKKLTLTNVKEQAIIKINQAATTSFNGIIVWNDKIFNLDDNTFLTDVKNENGGEFKINENNYSEKNEELLEQSIIKSFEKKLGEINENIQTQIKNVKSETGKVIDELNTEFEELENKHKDQVKKLQDDEWVKILKDAKGLELTAMDMEDLDFFKIFFDIEKETIGANNFEISNLLNIRKDFMKFHSPNEKIQFDDREILDVTIFEDNNKYNTIGKIIDVMDAQFAEIKIMYDKIEEGKTQEDNLNNEIQELTNINTVPDNKNILSLWKKEDYENFLQEDIKKKEKEKKEDKEENKEKVQKKIEIHQMVTNFNKILKGVNVFEENTTINLIPNNEIVINIQHLPIIQILFNKVIKAIDEITLKKRADLEEASGQQATDHEEHLKKLKEHKYTHIKLLYDNYKKMMFSLIKTRAEMNDNKDFWITNTGFRGIEEAAMWHDNALNEIKILDKKDLKDEFKKQWKKFDSKKKKWINHSPLFPDFLKKVKKTTNEFNVDDIFSEKLGYSIAGNKGPALQVQKDSKIPLDIYNYNNIEKYEILREIDYFFEDSGKKIKDILNDLKNSNGETINYEDHENDWMEKKKERKETLIEEHIAMLNGPKFNKMISYMQGEIEKKKTWSFKFPKSYSSTTLSKDTDVSKKNKAGLISAIKKVNNAIASKIKDLKSKKVLPAETNNDGDELIGGGDFKVVDNVKKWVLNNFLKDIAVKKIFNHSDIVLDKQKEKIKKGETIDFQKICIANAIKELNAVIESLKTNTSYDHNIFITDASLASGQKQMVETIKKYKNLFKMDKEFVFLNVDHYNKMVGKWKAAFNELLPATESQAAKQTDEQVEETEEDASPVKLAINIKNKDTVKKKMMKIIYGGSSDGDILNNENEIDIYNIFNEKMWKKKNQKQIVDDIIEIPDKLKNYYAKLLEKDSKKNKNDLIKNIQKLLEDSERTEIYKQLNINEKFKNIHQIASDKKDKSMSAFRGIDYIKLNINEKFNGHNFNDNIRIRDLFDNIMTDNEFFCFKPPPLFPNIIDSKKKEKKEIKVSKISSSSSSSVRKPKDYYEKMIDANASLINQISKNINRAEATNPNESTQIKFDEKGDEIKVTNFYRYYAKTTWIYINEKIINNYGNAVMDGYIKLKEGRDKSNIYLIGNDEDSK